MKQIALSNSAARALVSVGVQLSTELPSLHGQVALANDTLIGQSTYIEELTTYGIGYGSMSANQLRQLRDFLCPPRPSNSRLIRVTQYDENEPWATVDYKKVKRAPLADFAEVKQRTAVKVDRLVPNRGLTVRLDRDQLRDKPMWQQIHTQWLIDLLMRASVLEAMDIYSAAATNDATIWDAGANPDLEVIQRRITLANITGFYPRCMIMGDQATLKRRQAYENQLTAGSLARASQFTDEQMATAMGLDRVMTSAERYQSAAAAKTEIVGSNALLFTAVPGESPEDPSNLVRHVANASYGGGEYAVYITEVGPGGKTIFLTVENYELLQTQHTTGILKLAVN